ncbi:MAG: MarR family transcriptional regulator [Planctomycetota bacterium]
MTDRSDLFLIRDLPRFESIAAHAERYPELEPTSAEAYLVLLRVASGVLAWRQRFVAEHGLTQPQFTTLMLLSCEDHGPAAPSELAERVGVTRATMTGVLDALVADGLVDRVPDPDDRRMQRISMTEAGLHRLESILPEYFGAVSRLMNGVAPDDRRRLAGLLADVGRCIPGEANAPAFTPPTTDPVAPAGPTETTP